MDHYTFLSTGCGRFVILIGPEILTRRVSDNAAQLQLQGSEVTCRAFFMSLDHVCL